MKQFAAKTVFVNSATSIFASGVLILSTILTPFILSRVLSTIEYQAYAGILSLLPLLNILAQSLRNGSATRISLSLRNHDPDIVYSTFRFMVIAAVLVSYLLAFLVFAVLFSIEDFGVDTRLLYIGAFCLASNCCGVIVISLIAGPSSAMMDFIPENIGKAAPNTVTLMGLILILIVRPESAYVWAFSAVLSGPWIVAAFLALAYRSELYSRYKGNFLLSSGVLWNFLHGLRGLMWWNLAAYLATTISVTIVAVYHTKYIVPFTIATSLVGVTSAALIAVAGPISSRVAQSTDSPDHVKSRMFCRVNAAFQIYILLSALFIYFLPQFAYTLWVGAELGTRVQEIAVMLLPAYAIRLMTMAFTTFVLGYGSQEKLYLSPLLEGMGTVSGCLILGQIFGFIGIPIALMMSASIRLLATLFFDVPKLVSITSIRMRDFAFPLLSILKDYR